MLRITTMIDEAAPSPQTITAIAAAFAAALDADDFTAAGRWLAMDCEYDTGREVVRGRGAILASYADASVWAHAKLDDVRYESEVQGVTGDTATVRFTDYLVKAGGHFHRHRCQQELAVGPAGTIVRIVHRDIPGERESLTAFFHRCGVER